MEDSKKWCIGPGRPSISGVPGDEANHTDAPPVNGLTRPSRLNPAHASDTATITIHMVMSHPITLALRQFFKKIP